MASSKDIDFNLIKDPYDIIQFNNEKPLSYVAPQEKLIDNLKNEFPQSKKEIDIYVKKAQRAFSYTQILTLANFWLPSFASKIVRNLVQLLYKDVYMKTSEQVCREIGIINNKKLYAFLLGQFVNYGLPPKISPFVIGSGTPLTHFVDGSLYDNSYPKGDGPEEIVRSLVSSIIQNGGQCFVKAEVDKILTKNNQSIGIVTKDGKIIESKKIISGIGMIETLNILPEINRWQPPKFKPGLSHFVGFFGFQNKMNLPQHNLWYMPCGESYDLQQMVEEYTNDSELKDLSKMYLFISFPSEKAARKDKKQTCIILAECTQQMVEKYRINKVQRTNGYQEFKKRILDHMTQKLVEFYPQVKDNIEYSELGTPLSVENYLGRFASLGPLLDNDRFLNEKCCAKTKVKNLFLTGQDSFYPGICGAIVSGFFSAVQVNKWFN